MPVATVSPEVSIAYDTFGSSRDPVVLLVMGLGTQLIAWQEGLCRRLADRGRYVVRYDNRDCGLSSRWDRHPVDLTELIATLSEGDVRAAQRLHPRPATVANRD